jgi:hypothetical protein
VGNLILLLGVSLHLVGLVLGLGSDVGRVVSSVVGELLLMGQVHDVGADRVHKVLRVRGLEFIQDKEIARVSEPTLPFSPHDNREWRMGEGRTKMRIWL